MKCVCKGTTEIELPNGNWVERPARVEFYNNKWGGDMSGSQSKRTWNEGD